MDGAAPFRISHSLGLALPLIPQSLASIQLRQSVGVLFAQLFPLFLRQVGFLDQGRKARGDGPDCRAETY